MKRKTPGVTVTVRGRALKTPVTLSITNNCNKVCICNTCLSIYVHTFIVCLFCLYVHMCVDDVHMDGSTVGVFMRLFICTLQGHAGTPKEKTVTVQKEEQEISEVAVSNDVEVPVVKVEKQCGGWLGRKSKKKVEVISCSSSRPT